MAYGFNEDKTKADIEEIVNDAFSNKVDKVAGKSLSDNNFTNTDKAIVDGASTELAKKVDKVTGKGLTTNDFTTAYKTKVEEASYNTLSYNDAVGLSFDGRNSYSFANPFTCPHDGYVLLNASPMRGYVQLDIIMTSNSTIYERITAERVSSSSNQKYPRSWVFVKKGMKIYATTTEEENFVEYYPQTSYA